MLIQIMLTMLALASKLMLANINPGRTVQPYNLWVHSIDTQ